MADINKVIQGLERCFVCDMSPVAPAEGQKAYLECEYTIGLYCGRDILLRDALALLKEQAKKHISLHKKHVVTWNRNDTFSMRNLYESICEELLDEGELFIERTDDHEKVDFVFYVTEGR